MKQSLNINYDDLRTTALRNRLKILNMIHDGASGHLGGALSACDIVTYLGEYVIDYASEERDRFILSKGHAVTALYAELNELGIVKNEELCTFRQLNSRLSGHTNREKLPETEVTTGLLGQGLSYGVGIAFAKKIKKGD